MAEDLKDKLIVFKVDVDQNEQTSDAEIIRAMPTFKVYKKRY